MFFCAISGVAPVTPVISSKSGHVYEKGLIEKYIDENGKDPITGESLGKEDLVALKASPLVPAPRPPTATSIPSLLVSMQSEWDALMLESLSLKLQHQSTRQELAHALYREDAALRVIARVVKERDQAREALAAVQATFGIAPTEAVEASDAMDVTEETPSNELPAAVKAQVEETHKALSSTRKKRKAPASYPTASTLKTYSQITSVPSLHATKPAGISALDVSADGNLAVTGGNDKVVQIYDRAAGKVIATLKGHTKKVLQVAIIESEAGRFVVSTSADNKVKIWAEGEDSKWTLAHTLSTHKGDVTGLVVHPSKVYFATGSLDSTWALHTLQGETVQIYEPLSGEGSYSYSSLAGHPDGFLHALGTTDGSIRVWDIRDKSTLAATLPAAEDGTPVISLSFSENGYYLAAGTETTLRVFDLRKLSVIHTVTVASPSKITTVYFDPSAQFLAVAGTDLKVYANKTWEELLTWDDNAAELTSVKFIPTGEEQGQIVVSGIDRTIRVIGVKAE